MVRGGHAAVCRFDAPWSELRHSLDRANRRRYQPFGIALDKRYAFTVGARPMVYIPWPEAERIFVAEELWRVLAIALERTPPIDCSCEREWRVLGELPCHLTALSRCSRPGATPTNSTIALAATPLAPA
jgi:hypothetical protein